MNWIELLLSGAGRINRKTYLIGLIPVAILFGLLYLFLGYVAALLPGWGRLVIGGLLAVEALYFFAALSVKRMHDYGRSALFLAALFSPLFVVAAFLVQQKYFPLKTHEPSVVIYTILIVLAMVLFFWMLSEMLFRSSDEGDNGFGPAPNS